LKDNFFAIFRNIAITSVPENKTGRMASIKADAFDALGI
jgi:hypothetical protein